MSSASRAWGTCTRHGSSSRRCSATPTTWGSTARSWAPRPSTSAISPRRSPTWPSSAPPSTSTVGSRWPATPADRRERARPCHSWAGAKRLALARPLASGRWRRSRESPRPLDDRLRLRPFASRGRRGRARYGGCSSRPQRPTSMGTADDAILVLNAGSSSIKLAVFAERSGKLALEVRGQVEGLYTAPRFTAHDPTGRVVAEKSWGRTPLGHDGGVEYLGDFLQHDLAGRRLLGVGHRVVHGGLEHTAPVRVKAKTLEALERLVPLAPLHQPHNLSPIARLLERSPELPQVACFDTSFHRTNPDLAQRFALPAELHDAGVQRYGFHGLSYEYIAAELPRVDTLAAAGKTIVLHLGNGSSMCAMDAGRSVATTMGLTASDGLAMGTRCGALDPGVILYLMDERKMDARAIEKLLYHESGLLGLSGVSSDMRTLLSSSNPSARLAIDVFVYRIRRDLGSLAAALGGLDAIVFTGGIGEHAPAIRERVCRDAAWLGVEPDALANARGGPRISAPASRVGAWVIPTDEELMIARHTRRVLESR